MKIFSPQDIDKIVSALQAGQVVVFPTETAYGLGCAATDVAAVEKIFQIKGRRPDKPLLVVVDSVKSAHRYLRWNSRLELLAREHWQGRGDPLTIVGNYRKKFLVKRLASGVVAPDGSLALRVTTSLWLRDLCARFGGAIVATSANQAGAGEIYSEQAVLKAWDGCENCPDAFVNAGTLTGQPPSTIVSVLADKIQVLRAGTARINV